MNPKYNEGWLNPCLLSGKAAVAAFRVGMDAQGNEHLSLFTEQLAQGFQVTEPQGSLEKLFEHLNEMLAAQERKDMLWVADLLEHELLPTLTEILR